MQAEHMNNKAFKKMKCRYDPSNEKRVFNKIVQPRLVDIEKWNEDGWCLEQMEEELGLELHELFYMAHYLKLPELKKIFYNETTIIDRTKKSLIQKANGHYIIKEVLVQNTKTYFDANNKKVTETEWVIKKVREYIPKDTKALEFLLSNKIPEEYQVKGQEVKADDEETLNTIKNILVSIKEKANEEN